MSARPSPLLAPNSDVRIELAALALGDPDADQGAREVVTDDGLGTNGLSLTGTSASLFKLVGTDLYLKAGSTLDFETASLLTVTVNVDDPSVGATPDAWAIFNLSITDVAEGPGGGSSDTVPPTLVISSSDADGFLRKGETTTLTFDFSEKVTGFTASDIGLSPKIGSLGALVQDSTDPTIYHATFTPSKNVSGPISIDVGNSYSDASGNIGDPATLELYVNTRGSTVGTAAGNSLSGTGGADFLDGAGGNDTLKANNGDDWLLGGAGDDALDGGAGNDLLAGQGGNDRLTGGTGADLFVFNLLGFGNDTITDFTEAQGDHIDLRGLQLSYDDLSFSQSGTSTVITIGSDTITVANATVATFDHWDFLL